MELNTFINDNIKFDTYRNLGELQSYIRFLTGKFYQGETKLDFEILPFDLESYPDNQPFKIYANVRNREAEKIELKVRKVNGFIQHIKN